jgi:hypothetical protein
MGNNPSTHLDSKTLPVEHDPWSPFMIGFLADGGDLGTVYTMAANDLASAIAEAERDWVSKLGPKQRVELHAGYPSWRADSRRVQVAWELDAEGKIVRNDNPR